MAFQRQSFKNKNRDEIIKNLIISSRIFYLRLSFVPVTFYELVVTSNFEAWFSTFAVITAFAT